MHFCDTQYEELRDTFNHPATEHEVDQLQEGLGQVLPQPVREWLFCCNGQDVEASASCNDGLMFGLPFLSAANILNEWQFWRVVDKDPETGANGSLRARMKSCPERWVRREYSCPGWIPLVTDHMGNYLGVDLMPEPSGSGAPGQVIIFGRDFDTKVVVYGCDGRDGWAKFLQLLASELSARKSFQLEPPSDSDGEEDTIGYRSYFSGGGSGASVGGGDRGGEPTAGFFLVGEYRNWPILESWADRSVRRWEAVGVATEAEQHGEPLATPARVSSNALSSAIVTPALDPIDPLHMTMISTPPVLEMSLPSTPSSAAQLLPLDGSPQQRPRSQHHSAATRPAPAPAPLLDLPTAEDMRAVRAAEQARLDAHEATGATLGDTLRHMAPFKAGPTKYRNMSRQPAASQDDTMELSVRPEHVYSTPPPKGTHAAVRGLRGVRTAHPDDEPLEGSVLSSTHLMDEPSRSASMDSPRATPHTAPAAHVVSIDDLSVTEAW